jgi:hypothetical protein
LRHQSANINKAEYESMDKRSGEGQLTDKELKIAANQD